MAIVWLDLRVSDLERAQEFYHRLLGWTYEDFEEIGATIHDGGETLGMLSEVQDAGVPSETGAVVYLEVKDLRAALQVATSMGATVEFGPEEDASGAVFADILDPAKCLACEAEYASSCTHFCPGQVYRWDGEKIVLSASNCLHCMTCAVKCPYENIQWLPPEGGEGPRFKQM